MPEKSSPEITRLWLSKRFLVVILLFFGFINMILLQGTLNLAILDLTKYKVNVKGNENKNYPTEIGHDSKTLILMRNLFHYGFLFSALGGYLAIKFGGASVYGIGVLTTSLMTILMPFYLKFSFHLFLCAIFIEGCFESFSYASISEILSKWAPVNERSRLIAYCVAGKVVGNAVINPFAGYLLHYCGWQKMFYVTGIMGLLWCFVWFSFVTDEPSTDKCISRRELTYIQQRVDLVSREEIVIQWKKMLLCKSVWALCIAKFAYGYACIVLIAYFVYQHMIDTLAMAPEAVELLKYLSYFMAIFLILMAGYTTDYSQYYGSWKISQIHKLIMSIGYLSSAVAFIVAAFVDHTSVTVICFVLIQTMMLFNFFILQLVPIYLAPQQAALIAGFSDFWFALSIIFTPVSYILDLWNYDSITESCVCFLLSGFLLIFSNCIFLLFGTSKLQAWSHSARNDYTLNECSCNLQHTEEQLCDIMRT